MPRPPSPRGGPQRAIGVADQVHRLNGQVHTGGWLRFDGSRLNEERGACFVELRQPDLAEAALTAALALSLSTRRHGIVLTELAMVGVQRGDPEQLLTHATAAFDKARATGSVLSAGSSTAYSIGYTTSQVGSRPADT